MVRLDRGPAGQRMRPRRRQDVRSSGQSLLRDRSAAAHITRTALCGAGGGVLLMVAIVFPTSSDPGLYPQESGGRLINAFVEKNSSGAPGQTLWRRSAGLFFLGSTVSGHTRGFQDYAGPGDTGTGGASGGWTYAFWVLDNN